MSLKQLLNKWMSGPQPGGYGRLADLEREQAQIAQRIAEMENPFLHPRVRARMRAGVDPARMPIGNGIGILMLTKLQHNDDVALQVELGGRALELFHSNEAFAYSEADDSQVSHYLGYAHILGGPALAIGYPLLAPKGVYETFLSLARYYYLCVSKAKEESTSPGASAISVVVLGALTSFYSFRSQVGSDPYYVRTTDFGNCEAWADNSNSFTAGKDAVLITPKLHAFIDSDEQRLFTAVAASPIPFLKAETEGVTLYRSLGVFA